ncbi:class I SAM-dependent methyltransferase [Tenggerimyces flavus]|uniref:Class I SAM-dependent methyltransferase n=1 Tax=Tenggerimyces flavus TaxID=1708749 RepID=A0ABV7YSB4_9ACTN|nr:class I SAM-dependent methyltransferase [Tenggerimyces flavus]MBM7784388.1 SAM-dependent methyltransferase [Tenggerimyces flavus]
MISDHRAFWNAQAATYDDEADHGLRDPDVRQAWRDLLAELLPTPPAKLADLGCGTGTLSVLLAEEGYDVVGVDQAPNMIDFAVRKAKAAGLNVPFQHADASKPPLEAGTFDVVLARHVLWALPDPRAALERWRDLLKPGGRLVLIEGRWWTGGGLTAQRTKRLLNGIATITQTRPLTNKGLWGAPIRDERYAMVAVVGVDDAASST